MPDDPGLSQIERLGQLNLYGDEHSGGQAYAVRRDSGEEMRSGMVPPIWSQCEGGTDTVLALLDSEIV